MGDRWKGKVAIVTGGARGQGEAEVRLFANEGARVFVLDRAFDTDPESAWENFWRQFEYRKTRAVIDPSSALPDSTVDQFWTGLQADSSEGLGVQDYYHHGRQMIANSFLIRRTMALTRRGEVPDPSWYQDYIAAFTHLEDVSFSYRKINWTHEIASTTGSDDWRAPRS